MQFCVHKVPNIFTFSEYVSLNLSYTVDTGSIVMVKRDGVSIDTFLVELHQCCDIIRFYAGMAN